MTTLQTKMAELGAKPLALFTKPSELRGKTISLETRTTRLGTKTAEQFAPAVMQKARTAYAK